MRIKDNKTFKEKYWAIIEEITHDTDLLNWIYNRKERLWYYIMHLQAYHNPVIVERLYDLYRYPLMNDTYLDYKIRNNGRYAKFKCNLMYCRKEIKEQNLNPLW